MGSDGYLPWISVSEWKLSGRFCLRLLLLFVVAPVLIYTIKKVGSEISTVFDSTYQFSSHGISRFISPTLQYNNESGSIPLHLSSADTPSYNNTNTTSTQPYMKSQMWYLAAMKKLSYKKVTPSSLLLEQPYFHPDPNTRFELDDPVVITPPKCTDETRIVILTLSEPNSNSEQLRAVIRKTWGSVAAGKQWPWVDFKTDVKLLFVVGVRDSDIGNTPGFKEESTTHNDILQLNTIDSYTNLTRKLILGFKWINVNCPHIKYVVKADQDVFVNVPLLWQFLTRFGASNAIYGRAYFHGTVKRNGKWALSESVVPIHRFPVYTAGTAYVISSDAINKVLHTYYLFPYVSIEDAFITGIVASVAKIDRFHVVGFTHWAEYLPDACELVMDRVYSANGANVESMADVWREIQERGNGMCL